MTGVRHRLGIGSDSLFLKRCNKDTVSVFRGSFVPGCLKGLGFLSGRVLKKVLNLQALSAA